MAFPKLTDPLVRDLAWACFSTPLLNASQLEIGGRLSNTDFPLSPSRRDWLQQLDRNPAPLSKYLQEHAATRLGLYFESLWHFFLRAEPEVELLAHNLPLRDGGRTLGEFDCLYYCHRRGRSVHLELAVKYYLGWPALQGGLKDLWLGPNSHDRLDRKVARLRDHQSRLSSRPEAEPLLRSLGITEPPLAEVEIKGQLFQPLNQLASPPAGFNQDLTWAHWCRPADLPGQLCPDSRYSLLPRMHWLSARQAGPDYSLTPEKLLDCVRAHFQNSERALLIARLEPDGEQQRLFVTASDWPDKRVFQGQESLNQE